MRQAWGTTTTWNTSFSSWIGQGSRWLDPVQWPGSVWNCRFPLPPEPDVSWWYQYYHMSLVSFSGPTSWFSTFWKCEGTVQHDRLDDIPWQSCTLNYKGSPPETLGPNGESHHGQLLTKIYGSVMHTSLFKRWYPTLTSLGNLTSHLIKDIAQMDNIGLRTSCWETGLGNKQ